jgi:hypothetical protein
VPRGGPKFLSANVIGPETLPGATPLGVQMALLFDRVVDATSAHQVSNYTIPFNAVQQAKAQLSGRIVVANLQQPEGTYVPTSVSVSGIADPRGNVGVSKTQPLGSQITDPGAVVTGKVLNADGTAVSGAVVTYEQFPPGDCTIQAQPVGVSAIPVDAVGRYQVRYVRQDDCGRPFSMATQDPNTGGLRQVSAVVRYAGQQIEADLVLLGRGGVSGTVRDTTGQPVPGATVAVVSVTDTQIGAQTVTDGNGHYSVTGITVGQVTVGAGKGTGVGHSAGDIPRAGGTALIDVTLDSGAVSLSGTLFRQDPGSPPPAPVKVPNWPVVYSINDHPGVSPPTPVAVVKTDNAGNFSFTSVPEGNFVLSAQLTARDSNSITGFAKAGDLLTLNLTVPIAAQGTVSGKVTLPDGTPAAGAIINGGGNGVLTAADGTYSLPTPVQTNPQTISAITQDGLRNGRTTVLVSQQGQVVTGANILLSGLGTARFTVLDANNNPVPNQPVHLACGESPCGCDPVQVTVNPDGSVTVSSNPVVTGPDGVAVFSSQPVGTVGARAISSTFDVADATALIPKDKATGSGILRFHGTGTVTGTVFNPDNSRSFGATVALTANVFDGLSCTLQPGPAQQIQTDQTGTYRFTGIHAGPVAVTASQVFFPAQVGNKGVLGNGQTVNLDLHLVNTIAGQLSGTVFLPDGTTPAGPGITVTANGVLPDVTVSTDANSHYQFAKIFPQGSYTVTVRDPVTGGVAQDTLFLPTGQNGNPAPDITHNFRLKGKGTVNVQVVNGSNQPVDNAFVELTENGFPNDKQDATVAPGSQGTVTFQQVFEGSFSATASDNVGRGGRKSSVLPGPGSTASIIIQLTSTGTVQGHFFMPDRTTRIPFGTVSLTSNGRQIGQVTTDGTTDPGSFSFNFVPAGPVLLQAQDPVTGRVGFAAGNILTDGQTLPLDVVAEGLGTVVGVVTSNSQNQPGANVDIFSGTYHAATSTDSTGHYIVAGVPVGHIVVNASLQNNFLLGTNSSTLSGDNTQIEIDVPLRGTGAIQGTVVESDGKTPAPSTVVTVTVGGAGGGTQSTSSDLNGNFTFSLVPEGIATLTAQKLDSIDEGQAVVDVAVGSTLQPRLTLNGVGSITGHTTQDSAGAPVAGHLTITGTGASPYTFALDTDSTGAFSLPQVLAGPFTASLTVVSGSITTSGTAFASVAPNTNTDIVVRLQATGSVTGTVFRSDGVTPAVGANVTISVGPRQSVVVQAQTDGTFSAAGIPLGPFTVSINDPVSTGQALIQGQSLTTAGQAFDLNQLFPTVNKIILNDTPMAALSIIPADGTSGLAASLTSIVVTFSNPLSSTTGIQIVSAKHGTLNLPFTLTPDGKVATFTGLPASDQITVTATTDVTDTLGRHPLQPLTATFLVGPPDVVSITPPANRNQVATGAAIIVNFREPLAAITNLTNLIVVSSSSGPVAGTTALATATQAVFTPAAALPTDTLFTVTVNGAADSGGNVQTTAFTSTFATLDTIPPVVQLVSPVSGSFVNTARPGISFSANDALTGVDFTTATVSIDGQPAARGTLTVTPPAALTDGAHTVSATVADRAGNVGTASGSFTVDTQPASAATVSGVTAGQILSGVVALSLSATDATSGVASIDLFVDNNFFVRTLPPFQVSLNTAALVDGDHTLSARATDAAGNIGPAGSGVAVVFNNVHLTVSFTSPAAGTPFNNQFAVTATADKPVQRIDFSFAGQQSTATVAPYSATFSVVGLADGPQTVTATATDFAGNTATATLSIAVDRTPPAAPNSNLIDAEPPISGFSQVHGLVGSVEAFDTVSITNLTHAAQATASVAGDGTFSTNIAGAVDDTLSLTAIDPAGNRSTATLVTVRQTPSVPPATGNTSLNYAGDLVDRVGTTAGALSPDGALDTVFTMSLNIGSGVTRTISRIDISNGSSTHSAAAGVTPVGVAPDVASPFLNHADGSISLSITSGATLTLITSDSGFIQFGSTYTVTVSCTDGSRFVGTFFLTPPADRQFVAHSAHITANPPTLLASTSDPGVSTINLTDIRDVDGSLVPDGAKIALATASGASHDPVGGLIPSSGSSVITDGNIAANNPNFRVFTITGGQVVAHLSNGSTPGSLFGNLTVVQVQAADSGENVLGTAAIATIDINVRNANDRAVVSVVPSSMYADGGDRRSHFTIELRDSLGQPVPDGTKVFATAANCGSRDPNGFCVGSAGGQLLGSNGTPTNVFTVQGGVASGDYSSAGLSAHVAQTSAVVIQVLAADANGNPISLTAIGTATITLTGPASTESTVTPSSIPFVFPSEHVSVLVHHVHDLRGNLVLDGTNFILSVANCASRDRNGFCIFSNGGSIIDGVSVPGGSFATKGFTLNSAAFDGTFTIDSSSTVGTGGSAISNVQVIMAGPAFNQPDIRGISAIPISILGLSNAVGNAQPSDLSGDGFLHVSSVTFSPILDSFGNPVPDGSLVLASAANCAARDANGFCIFSAGGQILNGATAAAGSSYRLFTVQNGSITVSYGSQGVTAVPGQTKTVNVTLLESDTSGNLVSLRFIGVIPISISGVTSAKATSDVSTILADSGDRRATITITSIKDALGRPVPDGTVLAISAANCASRDLNGFCIFSAGGVILGGTTDPLNAAYQLFTATNGQVVLQYSSLGIGEATRQSATANVQVLSSDPNGNLIALTEVVVLPLQLISPGSARITVSPADLFAGDTNVQALITATSLIGSDGVTPVPDGANIGLATANCAARDVNGFCVLSVGGVLTSAGQSPADGTPVASNPNFQYFVVGGDQIKAVYSDSPIAVDVNQTQIANVPMVPVDQAGQNVIGGTEFAVATVNLHGATFATGSGPTTLRLGQTANVTFSGIKDSAGNLLPDGSVVYVTAINCGTRDLNGFCIFSVGGSIVGGTQLTFTSYSAFTVMNGSITVGYSATGSTTGNAEVQVCPGTPNGTVFSTKTLIGGVWTINVTN